MRDAEVVVVGAGPAGCSVAIRLAAAGISTVVVEAPAAPGWRVGETLPPGARPLLRELGVWHAFRADGHLEAAGNRSAWGSPEPRERDFILAPDGPGWQLDRRRFDSMLAEAARSRGAGWITAHATSLRRGPAGAWELELGGPAGTTLTASVVVDATGRSSWVGRECGARRRVVDRLVGVVALVQPAVGAAGGDAGAPDPRTLVEAVETGWWYSVPVPDGSMVVGHMSDPDLLPSGRGAGDHGWAGLLELAPLTCARLGGRAPKALVGPRMVAAGSSVLGRVGGDGWLAVGDAAATHDPLSSQGIAAALEQGRWAATAAAAALDGDPNAVHRYADTVITGYARYLASRAGYYDLERRWPGSPFWQRRQRPTTTAGAPASGARTGATR